jgi:hypothetical protein
VKADRFFSVDSPKAIKARGYGYVNAINYMAPAATGGFGNLCPHASPGCLALCLGWYSGQAAMLSNAELETGSNNVRRSRQAKAKLFMTERQVFLALMRKAINALIRKAKRMRKLLCVRLNGATDIVWEAIKIQGEHQQFSMIDLFPTVQFVDYTKNFARMLRFCQGKLPANLHLTFSRSETNEAQCVDVLKAGGNVAVVFAGDMPSEYLGYEVVNGDAHDLRHLDPKGGKIIGLSPKGRKAKADTTGFVVNA